MHTQQPKDELVGVRNDEARIYNLAYTVRNQAEGQLRQVQRETVRLMPGLNFVSRDELKQCLLKDEMDDRLAYDGLSIVDPTTLPAMLAKQLIAVSHKKALKTWRDREKRRDILAAIDARLGE